METLNDFERLDAVIPGFADPEKKSGRERDLQFPGIFHHFDPDGRIFSRTVGMGRDLGGRFKHQTHTRVHGPELLQLIIGEDPGIRVRQNPQRDCISAHIFTVGKDVRVSHTGHVCRKAGFAFGTFAEREQCFCAGKRRPAFERGDDLLFWHYTAFGHRGFERAVSTGICTDIGQWKKHIAGKRNDRHIRPPL